MGKRLRLQAVGRDAIHSSPGFPRDFSLIGGKPETLGGEWSYDKAMRSMSPKTVLVRRHRASERRGHGAWVACSRSLHGRLGTNSALEKEWAPNRANKPQHLLEQTGVDVASIQVLVLSQKEFRDKTWRLRK